MATLAHALESTEQHDEPKYGIGVLAGLEFSKVPNAKLNDTQKAALKERVRAAEKRDYPARLDEVIQAWEAALFYRGMQFLIPQRGGGWIIPGESTGYGPSMQMDLALLPTNIYSARGQMIIAALTRAVPNVRFAPQDGASDAQITTAESADKFVKVIRRNNDLIMIQTDACRYLWTDGRFCYWSRFVKDGQRFGWEEDDEPADIIPENEPADPDIPDMTPIEAEAAQATIEDVSSDESERESQEMGEEMFGEGEAPETEEFGEAEEEEEVSNVKRTPRGQEVRTAHGKLEVKLVPMSANCRADVDVLIYEDEVDVSRAKGMFPHICDEIHPSSAAPADGEIARLARQNVKLGMQSTYVTSDSVANDVTIKRVWMRPSWLMGVADAKVRDELIAMFPNGCFCSYAGEVFASAKNESLDDAWTIGHAYSGDGQNRNAMGTSTMPIQKRLNNWLDLMNDFFVRAIPKKWMDAKTFNVQSLRGQTNVPGDIGSFKWKPGVPVAELIFVEPPVIPPQSLADFIKEYSGPLAELLSGAYPALAGGDVGTADSGVAIATQRDSALGRLAPTWHTLKNCEAESTRQLVQWGAKCRDKSINEHIPGGEVVRLEINDLKGNIQCYPESDENFPETWTQKKNAVTTLFADASKNPQLGEVIFNAANVEFFQNVQGLRDLYVPIVAARNKQLGEIQLLLAGMPVPNEAYEKAKQQIESMKSMGVDPAVLQQAEQQLAQTIPQETSSIPIDEMVEDNQTEADTCWQMLMSPQGRKEKLTNPQGYMNLRLHYLEHKAAAEKSAAQKAQGIGKPPSMSVSYKDVVQSDPAAAAQMLQKDGITPTAGATTPAPVPAGQGAQKPAKPIPTGAPEAVPGRIA